MSSSETRASSQAMLEQPDSRAGAPPPPIARMLNPLATLDAMFQPRSVAVIGASERRGSVGRTVLTNLLANPFGGCVYPVNDKRKNVLGVAAYESVAALPEVPDLAVIVTPAPTVPEIVAQCGAAGVPAVVVISAGFKERGPEGLALESQILRTAHAQRMRIVGPNCLGVMNPRYGLNATFARGMALPGNLAFLSQSGALCTAILDWSLQENIGFSAFVSLGSMIDVNWGDLIDYFGSDPHTTSILLYMETVGDAKAFLSAARDVALRKPIVVIKGGRTDEASKAAASHTGSLAGSDQAFDAALRRAGVLRVDRIGELFSVAEVLAKQPRPKGRRLTIVTNAGGPGVLATDALIQGGGKLTELSNETIAALDAFLPPHWSHGNPIDVLGDADAARYAKALEVAARDPNSDGLLVVLTPQDMTDADATAEQLRPLARIKDKPVLASWMGGRTVEHAVRLLNEASIATFPYPDSAARAFNYLWQYAETLRNIYETPALVSDDAERVAERTAAAEEILAGVRNAGRTLLTEVESKRLLAEYGIPVVPTRVASSAEQAATFAAEFGFPAVIKLNSRTVTHKTDVRGVRLNLKSADEVREAYRTMQADVTAAAGAAAFEGVSVQPMIADEGYEIIIGSTLDPQFGPVVMFGAGGQLVEVLRDSALALPPLNETLAHRLIARTRISRALQGVRGRPPVDMQGLTQALIAFSRLVVEQPLIKECDINPLIVSPRRVLALDARIVVHDAATPLESIPRAAIRPYPAQYVREVRLRDGASVTLRPIRPEDEPLIVAFHSTLSEETVRRRFFQLMQLRHRTEHNRLIRVCSSDYDRELAIVAETNHDGGRAVWGTARLSRGRGEKVAEFAVVVSDAWQGKGLGTALMGQLIEIARQEGIVRLVGHVLADNYAMQALCKRCGFQLRHDAIEGEVRAVLDLVAGLPEAK